MGGVAGPGTGGGALSRPVPPSIPLVVGSELGPPGSAPADGTDGGGAPRDGGGGGGGGPAPPGGAPADGPDGGGASGYGGGGRGAAPGPRRDDPGAAGGTGGSGRGVSSADGCTASSTSGSWLTPGSGWAAGA